MKKSLRICVFCSSSRAISDKYKDVAIELGKKLAEFNWTLVYGGTDVGMMGILSETVRNNDGKVIGIIPDLMVEFGIADNHADKLIVTDDMRDRKEKMEKNADAFIIMPGGFGTLEETFEMLTAKQLGYHDKPIIFLNIDGFYNRLFDFFEQIFTEKFAKRDFTKLYYITDSVHSAFEYIKSYKAPNLPDKWFNDEVKSRSMKNN